MDKLYSMLHFWAGQPHEWSYCDCMTVAADWIKIVKGYDPAENLRGTYGNPEFCPIGRAYRADPMSLCDKVMTGLPVVETASFGDVALVSIHGQRFLSGAIKIKGRSWAMKAEVSSLIVTRQVKPVKIWGLNYEA